MPKKLHDKLKREAREKFPGHKERQDEYVYGTLDKIKKKVKRNRKKRKSWEEAKSAKNPYKRG